MKLLTSEIKKKLITNNQRGETEEDFDPKPVVKMFTPWANATWLFTEMWEQDGQVVLYGLCDLGLGCTEIGTVFLSELESLRGPGGLRVERDLHFSPNKTLDGYATQAQNDRCIRA